ncbi:Golgi apparatus membrane protein-like protein ECHIDNA [Populus alba x Populus x berolinensis]|nr:Golgi apparatus membrane protein-like protein ECHIDNA [Populus alba x Populus x berolinensis]
MDFSQVNNKHLSRVHFSDHDVALQFFFSQIIDLIMNIFLSLRPLGENYANPKTCFFHVLFKAAGLAMYILSALFFDSFVIIFVVMVLLAALDFWVVKNAAAWVILGIFSVIRFEADYVLVVAVCQASA